jgi:hypothetical protein
MSSYSRAGAACLVLAPLAGLVSVLVAATVSGRTSDLAQAFVGHPGATHAGLAINAVAASLLVGGIVWFAWIVFERSPRLAMAGGALGVLGMLAVLFDDAVHVTGSVLVEGMSTADATKALDPLTSGGVFVVGPLSELGDVGMILLAIAAVRVGLPRWAAAVLCAGAIAEGLGFATGSRYLAAAGFALVAVAVATFARTVFSRVAVTPALAMQHA